ncbi:acyltransferase [Nocardioides sp. CER19]|uniref:acyltransferase family protein n=1 Tax=Nocardioides sp. CER19 TaxID=3038538 RepID=UPI00244BAD4E|nr:acyltransferase [Nocardioides sp. CER19]MDH2413764.1 acyltransferase [Nocardioides sp. CER19]
MHDRGSLTGLDGLRGVAILLVLGQHAPTRPLIDGFVGVTVFFCLSGFLITTLLVRELEHGTIDVRGFYRRRVARLCPGLATVVAVTVVVLLLGRRDLGVGQVLAPAGAATTYTTSLFDWTDHVFATKDYFNYTWSLSVEEQFYLLWPCALLWGYRRGPRVFAALTAVLVATSLALNLFLGLTRAVKYDQHEYFGSDTNALPLLIGCLLAIAVHHGWFSRTVRLVGPGALPALALLPILASRNDTYRPSLVTVAGTGLTAVALIGVVTRPRSAVGSVLASRPMRWLGERSYSIYLWNVLARIAMLAWLGHTVVGDLAWIAAFVVLAEASFRLVERPMRARLRTGSGRETSVDVVLVGAVAEELRRGPEQDRTADVVGPGRRERLHVGADQRVRCARPYDGVVIDPPGVERSTRRVVAASVGAEDVDRVTCPDHAHADRPPA